MSQLLRAISATDLIAYFEFLDELRMSSVAAAALHLAGRYPGMTRREARDVANAWNDTYTHTLPAEDRALNALEAA
jgi:hypothetical protein